MCVNGVLNYIFFFFLSLTFSCRLQRPPGLRQGKTCLQTKCYFCFPTSEWDRNVRGCEDKFLYPKAHQQKRIMRPWRGHQIVAPLSLPFQKRNQGTMMELNWNISGKSQKFLLFLQYKCKRTESWHVPRSGLWRLDNVSWLSQVKSRQSSAFSCQFGETFFVWGVLLPLIEWRTF